MVGSLKIIKIGGSVITYKESESPKANKDALKRLASEIAEAYRQMNLSLVIVHGAGSYGHPYVKKTRIHEGIKNKKQLTDFAETQRKQNELNCIVTKALIANDLPAIPSQASAHAIMRRKKLIEMDTRVVKGFLDIGLIPVLYGVPAYDVEQGCSILSGDDIVSHLAIKLRAKQIIFGTDVNGVLMGSLREPNRLIPSITGKNFRNVIDQLLKPNVESDVTGGMLRKVLRAAEASVYGIESIIGNASESGILTRLIEGEKIGTVVKDIPEETLNEVKRMLRETSRNL